jgi:cell wall-associated NlpC family hydrolase
MPMGQHTRTSRRGTIRGRTARALRPTCAALAVLAAAALLSALLLPDGTTAAPQELTFGAKPEGLSGLQAQATGIRAEIDALDRRLAASVAEYNDARTRLDALNAELMQARSDLLKAEADLQLTQTLYGQRLAQMYKGGRVTLLDVLFSADDLTEITRQLDFYRLIAEADEATVDHMNELTNTVAELESTIESRRELALADELELRDKRSLVEDQMAQREATLDGVSARIKKLLERQARLAALTAGELAREAGVVLESIDATPEQLAVVRAAMRWLGVPYVWGGASPSGFDCSGLVTYVYAQFGAKLPHGATMQARLGDPVPLDRLQPADLVFFGSPSFYNHVGIYVGGGLFIEAPHTGDVVKVSPLAGRGCDLACRYELHLL